MSEALYKEGGRESNAPYSLVLGVFRRIEGVGHPSGRGRGRFCSLFCGDEVAPHLFVLSSFVVFQMHLDLCRNAYMQMNVKISLFSLTTSIAAVIAGIFGMNLPLWEASFSPAQPGSSPNTTTTAASETPREGGGVVVADPPYPQNDRPRERDKFDLKKKQKKEDESTRARTGPLVKSPASHSAFESETSGSSSSSCRSPGTGAADLLDLPTSRDVSGASRRSFVAKKGSAVIPRPTGGHLESLTGHLAEEEEQDEDDEEEEKVGVGFDAENRRLHSDKAKTTVFLSPQSPVRGADPDVGDLSSTTGATPAPSLPSARPPAPSPVRPPSIMSRATQKLRDELHCSSRVAALRDEFLASMRTARDRVHAWFLDHAFGVVACAVVLPVCLSGFLFCNQFARVFAVHGSLRRSLSLRRLDARRTQNLSRLGRFLLLSSNLIPPRSSLGTFISRILGPYSLASSRTPASGRPAGANRDLHGAPSSSSSSPSSGRLGSYRDGVTRSSSSQAEQQQNAIGRQEDKAA